MRGRYYLFASLAFAVLVNLVGQPATAQLAPSRSGSSSITYFSGQAAWDSLRTFGLCYASRNKPKAFRLIATEPGSRDEVEVYKALFGGGANQSCLSLTSELRFDHTMVRGVIAEGLYQKGIALPANMALRAPEPGETIRNLSAAARCYTASHVAEVGALLSATKPGSEEELAEIDKMMPEFGKCMPQGAKVEFSSTLLRFRLAESAYKLGIPAPALRSGKAQ